MNTKINLFTALIIVYSIVVCSVFKKADPINIDSSSATAYRTNKLVNPKGINLTKEVLTASVEVSNQEIPQ